MSRARIVSLLGAASMLGEFARREGSAPSPIFSGGRTRGNKYDPAQGKKQRAAIEAAKAARAEKGKVGPK
jgi:hypothetical protein